MVEACWNIQASKLINDEEKEMLTLKLKIKLPVMVFTCKISNRKERKYRQQNNCNKKK